MSVSTIAAIATPPGHGGIGIVKLSGPRSIDIALSIFRPGSFSNTFHQHSNYLVSPFHLQSHRLYYGHIIDDTSGQIIDEVLLTAMKAPRSYTAEDIVEIQCHAGPVVMRKILDVTIKKGARLAEPGEFTRRAFLNGRIDLTQAEAVVDIINARCERAIEMAASQVSGELYRVIQGLRLTLIDILSHAEAAIDFPDDVCEETNTEFLTNRIKTELIDKITDLISRADEQDFIRNGLKIVIIGAPNVGKSSLMNRLLDKERSIVTDIPGTTRDLIEDSFVINGVPVVMTDTAGIHNTSDPVEQMGIQKAWDYISGADIILLTIDAGQPVSSDMITLFEKLRSDKVIIVVNKIDLPEAKQFFKCPTQWNHPSGVDRIAISALYNQGIDELKKIISQKVLGADIDPVNTIVPNMRHKQLLEQARDALENALNAIHQSLSFEFIAIDLKTALDALGNVTGETVKPDILDRIFSDFCIGK